MDFGSTSPMHPLIFVLIPKKHREAVTSLWDLDAELATIAKKAHDPYLRLMRFKWWSDNISALSAGAKSADHPILLGLTKSDPELVDPTKLQQLVDIWTDFIDRESIDRLFIRKFAEDRGGLMFGQTAKLLEARNVSKGSPYGISWGLVDVAGHLQDRRLAEQLFIEAAQLNDEKWNSDVPKPLKASAKLSKMRARAGGIIRPLPEQLMLLRLSLLGD